MCWSVGAHQKQRSTYLWERNWSKRACRLRLPCPDTGTCSEGCSSRNPVHPQNTGMSLAGTLQPVCQLVLLKKERMLSIPASSLTILSTLLYLPSSTWLPRVGFGLFYSTVPNAARCVYSRQRCCSYGSHRQGSNLSKLQAAVRPVTGPVRQLTLARICVQRLLCVLSQTRRCACKTPTRLYRAYRA